MPSPIIQWFPGHMAQARRLIKENLSKVDLIFEVLDARIPKSSRNPEIEEIIQNKKTVSVLCKSDLSDPDVNEMWKQFFSGAEKKAVLVDSKSGSGIKDLQNAALWLCREKIEREKAKGMQTKLRAMIVGIPNVGKSTLINKLSGAKKAQAENRPGVTKAPQWIKAGQSLELLDMPGILWPKFEEQEVGENLAITGAIRDDILYTEEIAVSLCKKLILLYPALLKERYRLTDADLRGDVYDVFLSIGRKRGLLAGRGEVNEERCAAMLLDEFRAARIGRISLERPE